MPTVTVNDNPKISDDILFELQTPDAADCFSVNPYQINSVKIYYVERSFNGNNSYLTSSEIVDTSLAAQLAIAKQAACTSPSVENFAVVEQIQNRIELSKITNNIFYHEAKTVYVLGNDIDPAWDISSGLNSPITFEKDSDGNNIVGHFNLIWSSNGMREGDYFICHTWTPFNGSDKLSNYQYFHLSGNTQITTSIPTHFTKPEKYSILQERYLPEMFKVHITESDLTPEVTQELNKSVAKGFTFLEDMANQMVDLIDANATHESLLQTLAGTFGIKLKSHDPTLWRKQIKQAVPLFKKKGTLEGLKEALSQASITLKKFTRLWQLISQYTSHEVLVYSGSSSFVLSKTMILPIVPDNFAIYYRGINSDEWTEITKDYVNITNNGDTTTMQWIGDQLSSHGIVLQYGDSIRILYQIKAIPNPSEQTLENYVRSLSLMDQRDERIQNYPPKNWNVRLLEEDDSLFDILIPNTHPFAESVVYGKVRTEFPYSENVYNMEEYNGSKRDSTKPCDIDKDFTDTCSAGLSSKYNVDIEIENISNERIIEAQEILNEFTPFHSVLHSITLGGSMTEIIPPPVETIDVIASHQYEEFAVIDPPQMIFNRNMEETDLLLRNELANSNVVASTTGTGRNQRTVLFCPEVWFDQIGLDSISSLNYLEILAPSTNAGTYAVSNPVKHHATFAAIEPLNQTAFAFRLSREIVRKNTSASIVQKDTFFFSDTEDNFSQYNAAIGWKIKIIRYDNMPEVNLTYNITAILPNGTFILQNTGTLPLTNASKIRYSLLNASSQIIKTSITGTLSVKRQGVLDLTGGNVLIRGNTVATSTVTDIRNIVKIGDYVLYSGSQYKVSGFVDGQNFQLLIDNYTTGNVGGVTAVIYRRLADNKVGYVRYDGMTLTTAVNYETNQQIMNGANAPVDPNSILDNDKFKENFLVLINAKYYTISNIDGNTIYLNGPMIDWGTTGTSVSFNLIRYTEPQIDIPERQNPATIGYEFPFIDRRGNEVFPIKQEVLSPFMMDSEVLAIDSQNNNNVLSLKAAILNDKSPLDVISQSESISVTIERREET